MSFWRAAIVGVDTCLQFVSSQYLLGLQDGALAVHPFWLDRIEPRAFGWQQTREDAYAAFRLFDAAVMGPNPGAYRATFVPGGIVPDQHPDPNADYGEFGTTPIQKLCGQGTHRLPGGKPHSDLFWQAGGRTEQYPITSQRWRCVVTLGALLFDEAQFLPRQRPSMEVRLGQAAPPDFIREAERPIILPRRAVNQSVTPVFLRR